MKPAILVGIDTEADDQWTAHGRAEMGVRNADRLPALQALFEEFEVRPTYVVTHEMATRPSSRDVLRELGRRGRCEIGTHLHPWSSPPFRAEDLAAHTYPCNLPDDLLERQLRELTATITESLGVRPTTYRAGRNGIDGRSLRILEGLGYTVDTSVDPLFNERRKKGPIFAGAPLTPYHPAYEDVTRPGDSRILEIPITSATLPFLPKPLEAAYASLPPLPWRGAFARLGLRAAWLRPSYTPLPVMKRLADMLVARGVPNLNIIFHSSEILPGGSPYTPDEPSVERFLGELRGLLAHLRGLGARGLTYAEFAAEWGRGEAAA